MKGPAPEVAGAKKGGTLTITNDGAPPTFDPAGAYYLSSMAVLSDLVTRGLTGYQNADGKNTLVPDMGEDLGKQSADGLTWTFKIQSGLKWSDGQPITAEDAAWTFNLIMTNDSDAIQRWALGGCTRAASEVVLGAWGWVKAWS